MSLALSILSPTGPDTLLSPSPSWPDLSLPSRMTTQAKPSPRQLAWRGGIARE